MVRKKGLARHRAARKAYQSSSKRKAPVGRGARFDALVEYFRRKGGVKNPKALAATIGRRKYGKKRMSKIAAAGRKRRRK